MLRKLGIIFLLIIVEGLLLLVNYLSGGDFLFSFIKNQSLQVMGMMLALNIPTATFLIGHLMNIEYQIGKSLFDGSRREIRQNIIFMIVAFILQMMFLTAIPLIDSKTVEIIKQIKMGLEFVSLFLFLFYIFALFEISENIFIVGKYIFKETGDAKPTPK